MPALLRLVLVSLLSGATAGTYTNDFSLLMPLEELPDSVHTSRSTQALLRRETSLMGFDVGASEYEDEDSRDGKDAYEIASATCQMRPRDAFDIPEWEVCPQACPYWGEVYTANSTCHFICVAAEQCGDTSLGLHPNRTIAEGNGKFCRGCRVAGCKECAMNRKDECVVCDTGYELENGKCIGDITTCWHVIIPGLLVGGMFIYMNIYLLDLLCRPTTNLRGYEQGERHRARTKSRRPYGEPAPGEDVNERTLYPLSTNLLSQPISGPGGVLHFRFQFAWICWAFIIVVLWYIMAVMQEKDLLVLGTKLAETPKDLCYVIDWGAKMQKDYMGTKVQFIFLSYIITVVFSLSLAVAQALCFQRIDAQTSTMHDFAAVLEGLPAILGSELVEDKLKEFLETESEQKVVGVSIAWGYFDDQALVSRMVGDELVDGNDGVSSQQSGLLPSDALPLDQSRPCRWKLFGFIDRCMIWLMGAQESQNAKSHSQGHAATRLANMAMENEGEVAEEEPQIEVKDFLSCIETTDTAFVIFNTEKARDIALEKIKQKSPSFNGSQITLRECEMEPQSIRWCSFNCTPKRRRFRLIVGVIGVFIFLFMWFILFYVPYAYFVYSYPYESGGRPDGDYTGYIFSAIVVGGNLSMYCVCAIVVGMVGFKYDDEREAGYIVLYFAAIIVNTIMDMGILGFNSFSLMVAVGAHTSDNQLLSQVENIQDRFESYPIQKEIGENLAYYNWPCCFFLPFVGEAIGANILPWFAQKYIVKTNPELTGRRAEALMEVFVPMDMGRYSDIILNCALAAAMVWLPCGFNLSVFGGLVFSNVFIYLFDHYRTLRVVPNFTISDRNIDDWAMSLSSVIPAIFLSALVFKSNCTTYVPYCKRSSGEIFIYCFLAFIAHICIHLGLLKVIRSCTVIPHTRTELNYAEVAKWQPCSYFATNPIHCLRSKCIYKHDPPCSIYVKGKEHQMSKNTKIGQYFEDKTPAPTDK